LLETAVSSLDQIVRVLIFVTKEEELATTNEAFERYLKPRPAKTFAIVANLYGDAKVEMEFTALMQNDFGIKD
jgi:enamine deaminase RidA (YjgF/YER057c/UK114 family)